MDPEKLSAHEPDQPYVDSPAPRVIPRKDHPISRHQIDQDALKVLYRLKNHGYLGYLVGGGVRDLFLGKQPKDYDIATNARPMEVRSIFRNSRIIGRRFQLVQVYFNGGKIVEVSTFRKSSPYIEIPEEDGAQENQEPEQEESTRARRKVPTENLFGTPYEDAMRRDMTINALFYDINDFSIIDYVGGIEDLKSGIIRAVGCPHRSFAEDPVRMLRVLRHAARTGFEIESETYDAICEHKASIADCSPARVREEFLRELRGGCSYHSFVLMMKTGLLEYLFPAYVPVLSGPESEEIRSYLLSNLKGIDRFRALGEELPDPMLLSVFVAPFVRHAHIVERAPDGRGRIGFYHNEVREVIKPIIRDFGFSKGHAEGICQRVIGLMVLEQFAKSGAKIPRSFLNKEYFRMGFNLFRVEAEGRAQPIPLSIHRALSQGEGRGDDPTGRNEPRAPSRNRRRRRHGRRRTPETAPEAGGGPTSQV